MGDVQVGIVDGELRKAAGQMESCAEFWPMEFNPSSREMVHFGKSDGGEARRMQGAR